VSRNIQKKDKRTHIRVKPGPGDELKCAIRIKNINNYIKGTIIDISAGGCAVSLNNSIEISYLSIKTVYDPLLVIINTKGIKTLATLIGMRESFAGFKFDNIEAAGMRLISNYIHRRIMETIQK
jgi:c-di-GMP-binding flagellar brake protein YcgR